MEDVTSTTTELPVTGSCFQRDIERKQDLVVVDVITHTSVHWEHDNTTETPGHVQHRAVLADCWFVR